jgi:hypothetical protein
MSPDTELRAIRSDLITLVRRVDSLIESANKSKPPTVLDLISMERTRAIEWVLEDNGGIMRPIQIWSALVAAGRNDPKMEVQVTTFDLWKRGRIAKEGRGEYKRRPKSG